MTNPPSSQSTTSPTPTGPAPTGVRIASALCWVVGIFEILGALAISIPALSSGAVPLLLAVYVLAGVIVCVAAVQIRRQRKVGVLLMLLAWAIPTIVELVQHWPLHGSVYVLGALLFAGGNWKHLR